MKVSSKDAVRVFKALSDVTRVEIVQLLGRAPRNVTELTSLVRVSQPKVSRHLKILRDAGLLRDVRKGKWVWYELALPGKGEPTSVAITAIHSLFLGKEPRISRTETKEVPEEGPSSAIARMGTIEKTRVMATPGTAVKAAAPAIVGERTQPRRREIRASAMARASRVSASSGGRTSKVRVRKRKELEDFLL